MTVAARPAVGIDLGTTYSAIAHLDTTGRPTTLVNAEGDLITPSVVLFEGTNVVVGKEAIKAMATEAEQVAECAKRQLGNRAYPKPLGGRQYPPEVIQAMILHKLRSDAQRQLGNFHEVVITVPAYFDEVRRKATQDAGYMAGFEVLDIINEPTSAAIAFGTLRGFLNTPSAKPIKIMVYDLGGGTFDVTVMEIQGNQFNTLSTDGDSQLGGRDWDQTLMDYVAGEFVRNYKFDPREDPNVAGRLWRECEDCKRTLSARIKASIAIDFRGHALRVDVTREKFAELTRHLLDRTRDTARLTLKAAGLEWTDLDYVLLVGGSTRMPMVGEMLRELSGKEPDSSVSADEAVAHGAALRAGLLLAQQEGRKAAFSIRNVNSHSLGVVGIEAKTGLKRNVTLIPRNTPLPVAAKRVFRTQKPDQRSVLVQIVEGESPSADGCSQLGRCAIRDLPANLPTDTPIEVRFHYEANGRLTVKVSVANVGKETSQEIIRENSLTQEQLDSWRKYITGMDPPV